MVYTTKWALTPYSLSELMNEWTDIKCLVYYLYLLMANMWVHLQARVRGKILFPTSSSLFTSSNGEKNPLICFTRFQHAYWTPYLLQNTAHELFPSFSFILRHQSSRLATLSMALLSVSGGARVGWFFVAGLGSLFSVFFLLCICNMIEFGFWLEGEKETFEGVLP